MKTTKVLIILLVSFFFSQEIFAQETEKKEEKKSEFKVDASLRVRTEAINGYKKLPTENNNPNLTTDQQTRLNFAYKKDKMKFYISLQDARTWGEGDIRTGTGNFGNTASLDVFQAWASLKLGANSNLKLGRQALKVDGQRLIGARGWSNNGLSYDAAAFNFKKDGLSLSVVTSFNNQKYNLFADEYDTVTFNLKSMNYIHVGKKFNKNLYASFLALFTGKQPKNSPTIVQFKTTTGAFIKYNDSKLFAKGEAYYQLGKTIDGVDVAAYMFNAETGYNFGIPYIGVGVDYISGQDKDTDKADKFQSFENFYGARFKFNGNLNYFVLPKSTKFGGLVNPFVKLGLKMNKKNSLTAYYHMFQTQQDVVADAATGELYDKNLGSEIDIIYTYKINKEINIKAGYHTAFVSETLESFKGVTVGESETPHWFWLMFTFKPKLFSSK